MCGIAGFVVAPGLAPEVRRAAFGERAAKMVGSLVHRGPDALRVDLEDGIVLGHARLAIVDIEGGTQPMHDRASGLSVVFNGEIFNHVELRAELERERAFRTRSDTEVLLRAWAAWGPAALGRFIGQFAFALWDHRAKVLWLARDRVGICPLYYVETDDGLAFASEIKALLAAGWVEPALDPSGIKQALHLWAPVAPRTCVRSVNELPPGSIARIESGKIAIERWWELSFDVPERDKIDDVDEGARLLRDALDEAVRIRLRADVPVGAYLSGGLDSSVTCALAQRHLGGTLHTFSVAFQNPRYDESAFQRQVARELGTTHHVLEIDDRVIGESLPEVIAHAEQALVRSAPAPFFRLSGSVADLGMKVVLTGEGADEFLLGYDIFKETKVRAFWAKHPSSSFRPRLLQRLYPYLNVSRQSLELQKAVFGVGLDPASVAALGFSHQIRFAQTARIARFFARDFIERTSAEDPPRTLSATFAEDASRYSVLEKAQLLEVRALLGGYLLSAQGDRMLLGHGVEGRFPFLDPRVIDLAGRLTTRVKLAVLDEKRVLKVAARGLVPPAVLSREKFPYRAPIAGALLGKGSPRWVTERLARESIDALGVFDGAKVERFLAKTRQTVSGDGSPSEGDDMALVAIATTQLLQSELFDRRPPGADVLARVEIR